TNITKPTPKTTKHKNLPGINDLDLNGTPQSSTTPTRAKSPGSLDHHGSAATTLTGGSNERSIVITDEWEFPVASYWNYELGPSLTPANNRPERLGKRKNQNQKGLHQSKNQKKPQPAIIPKPDREGPDPARDEYINAFDAVHAIWAAVGVSVLPDGFCLKSNRRIKAEFARYCKKKGLSEKTRRW
ncbi:hypothetical protein HDU76_008127, partial [Blyttiomyces sp. JEL0837]